MWRGARERRLVFVAWTDRELSKLPSCTFLICLPIDRTSQWQIIYSLSYGLFPEIPNQVRPSDAKHSWKANPSESTQGSYLLLPHTSRWTAPGENSWAPLCGLLSTAFASETHLEQCHMTPGTILSPWTDRNPLYLSPSLGHALYSLFGLFQGDWLFWPVRYLEGVYSQMGIDYTVWGWLVTCVWSCGDGIRVIPCLISHQISANHSAQIQNKHPVAISYVDLMSEPTSNSTLSFKYRSNWSVALPVLIIYMLPSPSNVRVVTVFVLQVEYRYALREKIKPKNFPCQRATQNCVFTKSYFWTSRISCWIGKV